MDQTNKHGRERPRFADLAATAELSLAFEKVAANWGSRQSQAKTTSDQKPQTTRAKPQRKEECGAGEGLTISWKAFTEKVEWSHEPPTRCDRPAAPRALFTISHFTFFTQYSMEWPSSENVVTK